MKTQSIFRTGIIGLLSLVVLACEEDGNRMTEPDLSSALTGGALDMEVGNLLPDYETIDTKLRTAQMSGKAGKKRPQRELYFHLTNQRKRYRRVLRSKSNLDNSSPVCLEDGQIKVRQQAQLQARSRPRDFYQICANSLFIKQ